MDTNTSQTPAIKIEITDPGENREDDDLLLTVDESHPLVLRSGIKQEAHEESDCKISHDVRDPASYNEQFIEEIERKPIVLEEVIITENSEEDKVTSEPIPNTPLSSEDFSNKQKSSNLKRVRPAICKKCKTGFPSAEMYERHRNTVHKDELPFPCKTCKKRFKTKMHLKTHETIHDPTRFQGEPQYQCDICDKSYHLESSLYQHNKSAHLGSQYKRGSRNSSPLIVHSKSGTKNPTPGKDKNPKQKPKETFPCSYCDRVFPMKCELRKHTLWHTGERPHTCPYCQQSFALVNFMNQHIKTIHERPKTEFGKRHTRPKCQAGQPCPCKICGKVFKAPSHLERHVRIHTGEKPFSCSTCGMRFRLVELLNRHQKSHRPPDTSGMHDYKCRVCGEEFKHRFNKFRDHRMRAHKHIPYEPENEKPFACGVCGKPYFLRIKAAICSLLGHDPEQIHKKMFKHKCPECPPEAFGYHRLGCLRRHWQEKHSDKFLPTKFRKGMYGDKEPSDELPKYFINKAKEEDMMKNGIPDTLVKSEIPIYVDLGLLPIPEEEWYPPKKTKELGSPNYEKRECCGKKYADNCSFRKHMQNIHKSYKYIRPPNGGDGKVVIKEEPDDSHDDQKQETEILPESLKIGVVTQIQCPSCPRSFQKLKSFRIHERMAHQNKSLRIPDTIMNNEIPVVLETFPLYPITVNVNDRLAVRKLLNFQTVEIKISRVARDIKKEVPISEF